MCSSSGSFLSTPCFLTKTEIKFQPVGLSELLATICLCACSFFFSFHFYLLSEKVQACTANRLLSGLCGELVDISTCVKSHSFSYWQLVTHNRSEWLQHCFQLLIFAISSKLSKLTHLFIIIDHLNPSAASDNSYRGLAELRTWPDVSKAGRQVL